MIKEESGLVKTEPVEKKPKHIDQVDSVEDLLRDQSKGYWSLRDELDRILYRDHFIKDLLVYNQQVAVTGRDNVCHFKLLVSF